MSVKKRNEEIVQSVLQQIKSEAESRNILTGEYLKKYDILRYMTPFSGLGEISSGYKTIFIAAVALLSAWIIWNKAYSS